MLARSIIAVVLLVTCVQVISAQTVWSQVYGITYTSGSRLNVDRYSANTYAFVASVNGIAPNVVTNTGVVFNKSARPFCNFATQHQAFVMVAEYDTTVNGYLRRTNYVFFVNPLSNAVTPTLPASFPLTVKEYYDGTIQSFVSFDNSYNEIFYWTKVCSNETLLTVPGANILNCKDTVANKVYPYYIGLYKYNKANPSVLGTVFEGKNKPEYNLEPFYKVYSRNVLGDNGWTVYAQLFKGAIWSAAPGVTQYVLLAYVNSYLYSYRLVSTAGYNLAKISSIAVPKSLNALQRQAGKTYIYMLVNPADGTPSAVLRVLIEPNLPSTPYPSYGYSVDVEKALTGLHRAYNLRTNPITGNLVFTAQQISGNVPKVVQYVPTANGGSGALTTYSAQTAASSYHCVGIVGTQP